MDVLNLKFHSQQINSASALLKKFGSQGYRSTITLIAPDFPNEENEYRDMLIFFQKFDNVPILYIVEIFGIYRNLSDTTID
jgi:hypothetical protein